MRINRVYIIPHIHTHISWSFFRSKRVLPLSIKTAQGRQKSRAGQQYFGFCYSQGPNSKRFLFSKIDRNV